MNSKSTFGWQPSLGALLHSGRTDFRVWAPVAKRIELIVEGKKESINLLSVSPDGYWFGSFSEFSAGDRYRYRIDGDRTLPDPASRFQPQGVHGPSQIIDPNAFVWGDHNWPGVRMKDAILYELHLGTFSKEGTFAGAQKRLRYLAELGVTAIEIMPVADFPGDRNWGYDGVAMFAPARRYGTPDDFRALVNDAHQHRIAVLLDVVYNHFGPDGAYAPSFSPYYFSSRHKTFWGDAINLDGANSRPVRDFFIENALYWLHEFHIDGLRLDATHSMRDSGSIHFVRELAAKVRQSIRHREILLIAEDHRNLAAIVKPENEAGWGLDGVWSDDFHHELRRLLAGDSDGYYRDYHGRVSALETTFQNGWLFTGQYSEHFKTLRGTDTTGIPPQRFVFYLQNHDQVGNRANGERLHHRIDAAVYRAATVLFLCAPQTPLLFMGQEWGAETPFCYFTDHHQDLGRHVREGRLREFRDFQGFFGSVPDPQAEETFLKSKLNWSELDSDVHESLFHLYRDLIRIRKNEWLSAQCRVRAIDENAIALFYGEIVAVIQLKEAGSVQLPDDGGTGVSPAFHPEIILTTEDSRYCSDQPKQVRIESATLHFQRPGAVILRMNPGQL